MFSIVSLEVNANVDHFESSMDRAADIADKSMGRAAANADQFQSRFDQASQNAGASADRMSGNFETANEKMARSTDQTIASLDNINTAADHVDLSGWQYKVAEGFGAGLGAGIVVAQTWMEKVESFVSAKLKVIGIGLAIALVSVTAAAVYSAYRIISASMGFIEGLFTGDSYKSDNIDAIIAMNKEVMTLQSGLQLSAQEAAALNSALKGQGVDPSAYISTLNATAAAAHTNTDELDRLGIKYKDANGALLPFTVTLANAKTVLDQYAAGWDRNQAATALGLGTYAAVSEAVSISSDKIQAAGQRLIDYNLAIGPGTQAAVSAYQTSMLAFQRELDLTSDGFKKAFSDQIMPVLTDLADFFREGFPSVVNVFRYTMATITSLFYGLKEVTYVTSEAILESFGAIGDVVSRVGSAMTKALHGDFSGAVHEMMQVPDDLSARWDMAGKNIVAQSEHNAAAMKLAWGADNFAGTDQSFAANKGKQWVPVPPDAKEQFGEADKAIQKTIQQYQALENATRSAWEASLVSEKNYIAEAKKLRAQAQAAKPKDLSAEGQLMAGLDLSIASMKLERLSSTVGTPLDDIRTQSDLVRTIAAGLTDQSKAQNAISDAYNFEAKAVDAAAAAEKARQPGLRDEWNKSLSTVNDLTAALDALKKGTQITVHSDQAKNVLDQLHGQLDALKDKTIKVDIVAQDITPGQKAMQSISWSKDQSGAHSSNNTVPMNLTIPGMGTYPVNADADVAKDMQQQMRRAALKYGSCR